MKATTPEATGSMNNQPRRYRVRALHDVDGLTQAEIAERLGVSQATVQRDLATTVAPFARTPRGAPVYPPGRFDDDPEYQARVEELRHDMPSAEAKRCAAREFAGGWESRPILRQVTEKMNTPEAKAHKFDVIARGLAAGRGTPPDVAA